MDGNAVSRYATAREPAELAGRCYHDTSRLRWALSREPMLLGLQSAVQPGKTFAKLGIENTKSGWFGALERSVSGLVGHFLQKARHSAMTGTK